MRLIEVNVRTSTDGWIGRRLINPEYIICLAEDTVKGGDTVTKITMPGVSVTVNGSMDETACKLAGTPDARPRKIQLDAH